ncbi:hypothetical protein EDD21DRAFT_360222 [Dissophora ornata]|nr:hypothetical protein BGZ58_010451 [Dissophora ornata]KAI8606706.1 hypothetical protein EDD21DRAFT_360222 [Dissophora ornata]
MRRAGQPPRKIPATATGRVSFECDQRDSQRHTTAPSPSMDGEPALSSSAPSGFFAYAPFASFGDSESDTAIRGLAGHPPLDSNTGENVGEALWAQMKNGDLSKVPQESEPKPVQGTPAFFSKDNEHERMSATTMASSLPTSTHARAKPVSSKASEATLRGQRRHSSEDGLMHGARSLPLSMYMSNGQQPPTDNVYPIPSKCAMVFHMRDEVPRPKGMNGDEKVRGGPRPQSQPRVYQQKPQFPLKKSASAKCGKTVSFKEPEPWRELSTESSAGKAVATIAATVVGAEGAEGAKAEEPLVILLGLGSPQLATCEQQTAEASSSPPACVPAIMLTRPSVDSHLQEAGSMTHRLESEARHVSAPAAYPKTPSEPAARPVPTRPGQGHHRNMSAPNTSALSSPSSPPPNISRSISTGHVLAGTAAKSSKPPGSGNRFSRLWKNVAHKYGHNHAVRVQMDERPGVIRRGSDLEPLVTVGKD